MYLLTPPVYAIAPPRIPTLQRDHLIGVERRVTRVRCCRAEDFGSVDRAIGQQRGQDFLLGFHRRDAGRQVVQSTVLREAALSRFA